MHALFTFLNTHFIPLASLIPVFFLGGTLIKRYQFQKATKPQWALYLSRQQWNFKKIIALIFSILGLVLGVITFLGKMTSDMYWVALMLICGGSAEFLLPPKPDVYLATHHMIINHPSSIKCTYSEIRRLYLYTSGIFIVLETGERFEYAFNLDDNEGFIEKLRNIAESYRQIHFIDHTPVFY